MKKEERPLTLEETRKMKPLMFRMAFAWAIAGFLILSWPREEALSWWASALGWYFMMAGAIYVLVTAGNLEHDRHQGRED